MKKIILTAAIALGTLTAMNAQEKKTETITKQLLQRNYHKPLKKHLHQILKGQLLLKPLQMTRTSTSLS